MAGAARTGVVILGGGVAGLWARAHLHAEGYHTVLCERAALGDGQTLASQGILHSGVKYALSGEAARGSRLLMDAAATWRDALAGERGPDLRDVPVLAREVTLWSTGSVGSRAVARAAASALRASVQPREAAGAGDAFAGAPRSVRAWSVMEPVIEPRGLVRALAAAPGGPIVRAEPVAIEPTVAGVEVRVRGGDGAEVPIRAQATVLVAGAGNEGLLRLAGADPAALAQRRPLHMVVLRGAPADLFGHCVRVSDRPRLTITTERGGGARTWYIGGELAESGVERSEREQVEVARRELAACLPWMDLGAAAWTTLRVDRAEGRTRGTRRPEGPTVHALGRVIAGWPTKLALAPALAGMIASELRAAGVEPTADGELGGLEGLGTPEVAPRPWTWNDPA